MVHEILLPPHLTDGCQVALQCRSNGYLALAQSWQLRLVRVFQPCVVVARRVWDTN